MYIYTCIYTHAYIYLCISVGHIVERSPYSTDHQYRCLRKKQSSDIPAGEAPSNPAPHISMFRCRAGVDCLCEKNSHPRERGQMFSSTLRCGGRGVHHLCTLDILWMTVFFANTGLKIQSRSGKIGAFGRRRSYMNRTASHST